MAQAAVTVAQAQLVTERLTIAAAERLFDTGGRRHRAQAEPRPALAQCPCHRQPQPAGLQGARRRRLRRQRHSAAGQRVFLESSAIALRRNHFRDHDAVPTVRAIQTSCVAENSREMSMSNRIDEASGVAPVAGDTVAVDRPHRKLRGTLGVWGSCSWWWPRRRRSASSAAGAAGYRRRQRRRVPCHLRRQHRDHPAVRGRIHHADAVRAGCRRVLLPTSARAWAG